MNLLHQLILNNLGLKVLSLFLASLLWFQISGQETVQRTLSLPVEFVNLPSQLEIANDYQRQVDVVVRYDRRSMSFDDRDLAVVVDLGGATSTQERSFPLADQNIRNKPFGVEVLSMAPARIRLRLENTLSKYVEVIPELLGEPAEGFEVISVHAPPVMVTGPESTVQQVTRATTEAIGIEGLASSMVRSASVDVEDPRLRIQPASVNVVVTIEEKRREVRIPSIPVRPTPEGVQAQLITSRVEVLGTVPLSFTGKLTAADFRAIVNLASLEPRQDPYDLMPSVAVVEAYREVFRLETVRPELVRVRRTR